MNKNVAGIFPLDLYLHVGCHESHAILESHL